MNRKSSRTTRTVPRSHRPIMPEGYGIAKTDKGLLSWSWVLRRLKESHNYWVVSSTIDGHPHSMPVWGVWVDRAFCFSTHPSSRKARNLRRNPRVLIHLESGDEAVILEGFAMKTTDPMIKKRFYDLYYAKYKFRLESLGKNQITFILRPRIAFAWREKDFADSATRWTFTSARKRKTRGPTTL